MQSSDRFVALRWLQVPELSRDKICVFRAEYVYVYIYNIHHVMGTIIVGMMLPKIFRHIPMVFPFPKDPCMEYLPTLGLF